MELLFGIDVQKKFSLLYTWDREKNFCIKKEGSCIHLKLKRRQMLLL